VLRRFFSSDEISRDFGLLLVRVGVGLSVLIFHGYGKITGGVETWEKVGGSMGNVQVTWFPVFWGFMAAFAESIGSCLLIIGVLFRPVTALLAFTMFIAVMNHLSRPPDQPGAGWSAASHALELMSVYLCLLFTGPGRLSLTPRR
jgi:putative oxidoreductase